MDVRPIHMIVLDHDGGREVVKARDDKRVAAWVRNRRAKGMGDVIVKGCHKHCPCGGRLDSGEIQWGEAL